MKNRAAKNNINEIILELSQSNFLKCENVTPHLTAEKGKQKSIYQTLLLLRSEIPSGMCAELRTVAASNNRDHPTRSLYYCLFAPHT